MVSLSLAQGACGAIGLDTCPFMLSSMCFLTSSPKAPSVTVIIDTAAASRLDSAQMATAAWQPSITGVMMSVGTPSKQLSSEQSNRRGRVCGAATKYRQAGSRRSCVFCGRLLKFRVVCQPSPGAVLALLPLKTF